MQRLILILCLGALAACSDFPELDRAVPDSATQGPYPTLVPVGQILNGPEPIATEAAVAGLAGRVAALRARAARLQARAVIDRATRARMRRGVRPM